jgi:DNA-binding NarL/FixJ family response regulator
MHTFLKEISSPATLRFQEVAGGVQRGSGTPPKGQRTRVVVVDDHPLVRERLTELINCEPDLQVCGEAEDRPSAARLILDLQPDLAIVDLSLRNSHGLDLIKDIRAASPKTRILVLSMHDESLYAERVLRAGAQGYITKQEATRKLLFAIRIILEGKTYLSETTSEQILTRLCRHPKAESADPAALLSDREMQVFELTGGGLVTKQIAAQLGIDIKTVETHRARAKEKLGHRDYADFLHAAIRYATDRERPAPPPPILVTGNPKK